MTFMKSILVVVAAAMMGFVSATPVKGIMGASLNSYVPAEEEDEPLPEGLFAVQYIESDGASWIDLGRNLSPDKLDYGYDCVFSASSRRGNIIHVNQISTHATILLEFAVGSKNWVYIGWRGSAISGYVDSLNRPIHVMISQDGRYDLDDGAFTGQFSPTGNFSYGGRLALFASTYTSVSPSQAGARVHHFRLYREGDFDIDFIPVRFINEEEEWEGAMYDRVSGEVFRNSGMGKFIIGPDKKR